jgi:hypothetical protein
MHDLHGVSVLVEDEKAIATFMQDMLERVGCSAVD